MIYREIQRGGKAVCNCIREIKDRVKNEIVQLNTDYKDLEITKVECENEVWIFTDNNKMVSGLSIPFIAEHQPVRRKKKTTINMIATYCPFCGKLYKNETENE